MKKTQLVKELRKIAKASGVTFSFVREGAKHEIWNLDGTLIAIPRHADINELTAKSILRDAKKGSK